jgi:hypothetical protein
MTLPTPAQATQTILRRATEPVLIFGVPGRGTTVPVDDVDLITIKGNTPAVPTDFIEAGGVFFYDEPSGIDSTN